ncbi:CehA/McbA family metallohydrolase [Spongiibacter sp. KMU-158]|uniref:CehA/McbA family metallohydrolase n=1 Tax=Spongiibacter pelagi TaxID=2760804 RepID=A0A927GUW8_9GAMM|nr:CehA/McbA family metallohydrolase [Spongiibacter pelagi]MBD2857463.1 CehA/McbA family metallohydrolase [Spongiibacter pelagi]
MKSFLRGKGLLLPRRVMIHSAIILCLSGSSGLLAQEDEASQPAIGLPPMLDLPPGELPGLGAFANEQPMSQAPKARSLTALQITEENIGDLARGGPDGVAGIGDWWLSNGELCVAISDVEHDTGIVRGGGNLVDYSHCDLRNDQWTYSNILTGLAKETAIPVRTISAKLEGDTAEIIAVGEANGLRQTVTYRLERDASNLEMEVLIERVKEGDPVRISGFFTLHTNTSMTPYTLSSYMPDASLGFQQLKIDRSNTSSLLAGLMPADWNILVGTTLFDTEASYGVQLESVELLGKNGSRQSLPTFLAVFPDYSMHGWLTRPLWFQSVKLDTFSMLQNKFMDLKRGERMLAKFRLRIGKRSDVAAITDQVYRGPILRGYSNYTNVSFSVWDPYGRPVTQARPDADGSFYIRLPRNMNRVRVDAVAPWGQRISRDISVSDERNDTGRWIFRRNGRLELPRGIPMSLYFFGMNDTPDPAFGDDLLGFSIAGELQKGQQRTNRIDLAGIESDAKQVSLPPGQYRVLVARGIEYKVKEYLLSVVGGKTSRLPIVAPVRHWYSENWRSTDLHVHSGASFDSALPIKERVRSFVAQGAEVLVASEHNRYIDQRQTVTDMGLEEQVQLITGSELTGMSRGPKAPFTIGHSNVFPVEPDEKAFAGGIVPIENRRLGEVIAAAKERDPESVFQLNHPRSVDGLDADSAFFEHLSLGRAYDPRQPLDSEANRSLLEIDPTTGARDLDFDLLEVLNGSEFDRYPFVRNDWFSLLNQGVKRVATGNSDSHGLQLIVGLPRNYVYLPGSIKPPVDEKAFVRSLKQGHSYLTTGPLLKLTLRDDKGNQFGMGDTLASDRGTLDIQVEAAPWVNVERLNIWVNGQLYRQLPVSPGDHKVVEVVVGGDAWLVVEVDGPASEIYQMLVPDMTPLALSNPIYFDADANGEWRP